MEQPIETQIALLAHDQQANKELIARLAATTDRIGEVASYVAKILAVHDERITSNEQSNESLSNLMEKRREDTDKQFREVNSRIEFMSRELKDELEDTKEEIIKAFDSHIAKQNEKGAEIDKRIRTLENWRWMLIGGGLILGFIIGRLPSVNELLKVLIS
jgi:hypothetical protein